MFCYVMLCYVMLCYVMLCYVMRCDAMRWDEMRWGEVRWGEMRWDEMRWDEVRWGEMRWDEMRWDEMRWDEIRWQINNVIWFFGKLDSTNKFKLVKAYCTSYYGCEMWSLWNQTIEDMCIAWRKGVRRIWGLPFDTHNVFLPRICDDISILDELCFRSMGFVSDCLSSECTLIRFETRHGLMSRMRSLVGRNTLFCLARCG